METNVDILGFLAARRAHDTEALRLQLRIDAAATDEEKSALRVQLEDRLLAPPDPKDYLRGLAPAEAAAK